jgi:hypothetical protein
LISWIVKQKQRVSAWRVIAVSALLCLAGHRLATALASTHVDRSLAGDVIARIPPLVAGGLAAALTFVTLLRWSRGETVAPEVIDKVLEPLPEGRGRSTSPRAAFLIITVIGAAFGSVIGGIAGIFEASMLRWAGRGAAIGGSISALVGLLVASIIHGRRRDR